MNIQSVGQLVFECLVGKRVEVEAAEERISSDAGLLPIREFDRRLGWSEGFADQIHDGRCGCTHAVREMVRQRVFGILAGYEDQNDHDTLRSDGVFKLIAGRSPDGLDLASQPTLSRLENAVTAADLLRLEDWFLAQFSGSFDAPPTEADSGYAVPTFSAACEEQQVEYTIGLGMNRVLQRESDATLQIAVDTFLATHQPQRLFTAFEYQAASWPQPRWVVVKCALQRARPEPAGGRHQSARRAGLAAGRV